MNNCFEKVILNLDPDSDLDEDNGESNVAYRPIDKFVCTLPALIGSDKWKEKWHCGLIESNDESSSSDTDNNYSEDSPSVSSKADIEQTTSINHDDLSNILIKSVEPQHDYYEQPAAAIVKTSAGLFDISDDDEILLPPKSPISNTVDTPATSFFREQVPRRKLVNLFDDQPPDDLPPNEPEDSDQDIFVTPIETTKKVIAKQPVDLFNDNEFDSYIKKMETSQQKTIDEPPLKEVAIVKKPLPKITNLFEDEIETDYFDEIMKNKTIGDSKVTVKNVVTETIKQVTVVPVVAKNSKISNLFSDDSPDDDDFDDLFAKKPVEIMKANIFVEKEATTVKRMESVDLFGSSSTVDDVMIPSLIEKPPEIDWEIEDDNYEDSFEKSAVGIEKVSQSNINFTSVPIFDDLPPDDDDFNSKESAQLENSSIFFDDDDDESDLVPSFNISNEVINDEPPPLSDDETDRSISVKEKLSKFKNIEKTSGLEEKVKKVLPKKLNTSKFNINVNALLPGSRLPPLIAKPDETLVKEPIEEQLDQNVKEYETKQENLKETNILDNNLTKSRVRNVKKRPSTRHGREALYKKNLSDETITDTVKNLETIKSTEQNSQSLFNDVEDVDIFATVLKKSVETKGDSNKLFDDEPESSVVEISNAVDSDVLKVHKTFTTNKISMFYDDKNDVIQTIRKIKEDEQNRTIAKALEDDKVFKKVNLKIAPKAKVYVESTSDDDLFGPSNVQEQPDKFIKKTRDEDLFGSSSGKSFKPVNNDKSILKDKPKQKIVSLFDDDYDDCDDLFSSSKANVVVATKVTNNTGSLFDDDGDIFSKTKSIAVKEVEKATKPKVNTKSLFDDSEDDDLFNTKSNVNSKAEISSVKVVKKIIDNPLNI